MDTLHQPLAAAAFGRTGQREVTASGHAGFEEAYLAHRTAIYGHVLQMMGNEADAEDLTLTAFEKALRAWDRHPPDGEIRPWLFRIATNCCLDELRRRKRIRWQPWDTFIQMFHPSQVAPNDPEKEVLRSEEADLVSAALAQLSPQHRAALIMRECYELSNAEVGQALNISRDGAKMLLFRARHRLRAAYLELAGQQREGARPPSGEPSATVESRTPAARQRR